MTTITASSTIGVVLSSPTYTNPIGIGSGVTISGSGDGIFANTGSWTIQNAGSVAGNTTSGAGIQLEAGGSVTNQSGGTIGGDIGIRGDNAALAVVNYGAVAGNLASGVGIYLTAGGSVTNQSAGTISGKTGIFGGGTAVAIVNYGSIAGNPTSVSAVGIRLVAGGDVTNHSGGAISGRGGIYAFNDAVTVANAGSIAGNLTSGTGIDFFAGGAVTNAASAVVIGHYGVGVSIGVGTVVNAGTIAGDMLSGEGVFLAAGGSVTNQSTGTISGYDGIAGNGAVAVTVVNAGTILGNTASGEGVFLNAGGSVTNHSTGTISGAVAIYAANGTVNVANDGRIAGMGTSGVGVYLNSVGAVTNAASASISGGKLGVYLSAGGTLTNAGTIIGNSGTAVVLGGAGSNLLVLDPGFGFSGVVAGGTSASNTLELASGASTGTLSGLGSQYVGFAQATVDAGASWALTGANTIANGTISAGATLTELGGASVTDTGTLENDGAIVLDPSTLIVAELIGSGSVTIEAGSTLGVQGTIAGGETITFAGSGAYLDLNNPGSVAGSVTNFAAGETIDLAGVNPASVNFSGGRLNFGGGSFALSLANAGTVVSSASGDGAAVTVLCFCANTLILTPSGERPVQELAAGDLVTTWRGAERRIAWVGVGKVLATRGRRNAATPVVVCKGALADNMPHHDLRVTKGHAFYLDGVLIPVEFLVNHCSVVWDDHAQEVALYHIELASHDVLVANGAPAESYRDDGNRWLFQNASSGWSLPPQEPCAPVLTGGAVVDAVWRRLLERAGRRRHRPFTDDADLHLLVDGRRFDAAERRCEAYIYQLTTVPSDLRIVSRAAAPAELGLLRDPRRLGVALRRLVARNGRRLRVIEADDDRLTDGFHAFENDNGFRWTNGDACIPAAVFAGFTGPLELELRIGGATRYVAIGAVRRAA